MNEIKESPFKSRDDEILNKNGFPFRECRRCDGSGHHSYNPQTGTICFNCLGTGNEIVPRAHDAYIAWLAHIKVRKNPMVSQLEVGDKIAHEKQWKTVVRVTQTDRESGWSKTNEVVTRYYYYHEIELSDGTIWVQNENCIQRRQAVVLDPTPFLAMIKPKRAKKS